MQNRKINNDFLYFLRFFFEELKRLREFEIIFDGLVESYLFLDTFFHDGIDVRS